MIVVTASKRPEPLNKAAASIAVLGSEGLEMRSVRTVQDLNGFSPNIQVNGNDASVAPNIYIRGVGSADYNPNNVSPVGIYINGVARTSSIAQLGAFFDVEQVEVARGPQGTLYGRNANGGVVSITSRRPSEAPEADASLRYGSYNRVEMTGGASGPLLSDALLLRVAGTFTRDDGYSRNRLTGRRINGLENAEGRITLLARPASDFEVLVHVGHARNSSDTLQGQMRGVMPADEGSTGPDGFCLPQFYFTSRCTDLFGYSDVDGNPRSGDYLVEGTDKVRSTYVDATTTWSTAGADFISVTGYVDTKHDNNENTDFGPNNLVKGNYHEGQSYFSQEIRIQSPNSSKLRWIAGAFYGRDAVDADNDYELGLDAVPLYPDRVTALEDGLGILSYAYRQVTHSYSIFGQIDWPLSSRLMATLGARWSRDSKSFIYYSSAYNGEIPFFAINDKKNFDSLSLRAAIRYNFDDRASAYASFSRGYKSGGFFGGNSTVPEDFQPYRDERLDAYEIGLKGGTSSGLVSAAVSAFYYDYKNLQIFSFVVRNDLPTQALNNASDARIFGAEAELHLRPLEGLSVTAGAGFINSKFQNFQSFGVDLSGNRPAGSPKTTLTASLSYDRPLFSHFDLVGGIDANYRSSFYFDPTNASRLKSSGYWLANAQLGIRIRPQSLEFGLWAKNLFNTSYTRGIVPISGAFVDRMAIGEPRYLGAYVKAAIGHSR